jgi:lipopolysaccharide/colanic/teichoic acid biosynthesis glycosyltransferase
MAISRAIAIGADRQTLSTGWPVAAADRPAAVTGPAANALYRASKRALDFFGAIMLLVALLPLFALLGVAIVLDSGWPVLYRGERVGRYGDAFTVLKFRSMRAGCDQGPHAAFVRSLLRDGTTCDVYKVPQDARVTRVGRFLRRTSLDELPQLWNVIRGDMSLVGPRPFPSYHMSSFDDEFRAIRVSVQPGITGMWQVSSRSDGDLQVQRAQDLFYIRNWSIWLDIYILLQTVPAVLSARGAK